MRFFQIFYEQDGKTISSRRFIGIIGFLTLVVSIAFDICCDKTVDSNLIDALVWIVGVAMAATTTDSAVGKFKAMNHRNKL